MNDKNINFNKTEKIEIRLNQNLADKLPKEKKEKNDFICRAIEYAINKDAWMTKAHSAKSSAKTAAARENGKKGGRPPLTIGKKNIIVEETTKITSIINGVKVHHNPHITGWNLSYKFPNGEITEKFYQSGFYDLNKAKHVFYKTCIEPRQAEFEQKCKRENNG